MEMQVDMEPTPQQVFDALRKCISQEEAISIMDALDQPGMLAEWQSLKQMVKDGKLEQWLKNT